MLTVDTMSGAMPPAEIAAAGSPAITNNRFNELASPTKSGRRTHAPSPSPCLPNDGEVWVRDEEEVWIAGRVENQLSRSKLAVRTSKGLVEVDLSNTDLPTVNPTLEADMT
jgi:hypothetical protein